jgi:hypothetical protein
MQIEAFLPRAKPQIKAQQISTTAFLLTQTKTNLSI